MALKVKCTKLKSCSMLMALFLKLSFFTGEPKAVTDEAREEAGVVSSDLNIGSGITATVMEIDLGENKFAKWIAVPGVQAKALIIVY